MGLFFPQTSEPSCFKFDVYQSGLFKSLFLFGIKTVSLAMSIFPPFSPILKHVVLEPGRGLYTKHTPRHESASFGSQSWVLRELL